MPNIDKNGVVLAAVLGLLGGCGRQGGESEQEIRNAIDQVDAMIAKQQKATGGYQNQEELGKLKSELERQLGEISAAKDQ
ncbi:MAG: hypothetical protein ACT4QB_16275 [Gammaproteobacteria bacterium]